MRLKIKGAKALKKQLTEDAELKLVKRLIKYHTTELNSKAMIKAPVDTGFLKRSLTVAMEEDGMTGRVKATADYAGYVEKGTRFMAAKPYLEPSLNEVKPGFLDDLKRMKKR